jgi:type II secretory pathway pseudopilin PulG
MQEFNPRTRNGNRAFTLIEIILILFITAILAAMLMPPISHPRPAPINKARLEMSLIVSAIHQYHSTYNRYPAFEKAIHSVWPPDSESAGEDFAFGATIQDAYRKPFTVRTPGQYQAMNSEVIAILMDLTNFPSGGPTVNADHLKNPRQIKFLNADMAITSGEPGVGPDLVFRDPWGNPYLISMDLNGDGKCRDAFYRLKAVSQLGTNGAAGHFGLANSIDTNGDGDHFEYNGDVMVWSAGPEGRSDPSAKANEGVNKDNVLSWKSNP